MSTHLSTRFYRVAWQIDGLSGHGKWLDKTHINELESHRDGCNQSFGAGSHWIEHKDASESLRVTMQIIESLQNRETLPA